MQTMHYSSARNHLKKLMEQVCDNYDPVIITNKAGKNVVMLPLDEFNAIQETLYLLSTPANRDRLLQALQQAESGNFEEKHLIE